MCIELIIFDIIKNFTKKIFDFFGGIKIVYENKLKIYFYFFKITKFLL